MIDPLSAGMLEKEVSVDSSRWSTLASDEVVEQTVKAVQSRGISVFVVPDKAAALNLLIKIIPPGSEVMNGSSTTLNEIGFTDYLKSSAHSWKNLHLSIFAEKDPSKQRDLRRKALAADYFLSGVNAIAQTGELVACDASGSRVGAFSFAAKNLILVSGTNKIVPTLEKAIQRVKEYAFPLEDVRAKKAYGMPSRLGKMVILMADNPGRTTLVMVKEKLGF